MPRRSDYWFTGLDEENDLSVNLYERYAYGPKSSSMDSDEKLKLALRIVLILLAIIIFVYVLHYIVVNNRKNRWLHRVKFLHALSRCYKPKKCCDKKKKNCCKECANKYVLPSVDDAFFVLNEESPQIWARLCTCCEEQKSKCKQCKFHFLVLEDNREEKSVPVDVPNLAEHELIYDCESKEWSVSDVSDSCQQLLNCVGPDPPTPG